MLFVKGSETEKTISMETKNNNVNQGAEPKNENIQNQQVTEQKETAADIILRKLKDKKEGKETSFSDINKEIDEKAVPDTQMEEEEESLVDLNKLSKEDIYKKMKELLDKELDKEIINEFNKLKDYYYKRLNQDKELAREKFINDGGKPEEFKYEHNETEKKINDLIEKFKELKREYQEKIELEQHRNLKEKERIIEEIEQLMTKQEKLRQTFEEFRALQEQWRQVGQVPPQETKRINEKYQFVVKKFYDWVKLNKEMRDLDLKKNLELKILLCEKAENLLLEPRISKAYKELQKLHLQWKEIGPVPKEKKDEIWERFKSASDEINKRYREYLQNIRKEQEGNLKAKTLLCEEAEKIANGEYTTTKQWQEKTKEIIELQKIWRRIGFAPKKYNNSIYQRFRKACDLFFEKKRQFFENYGDILQQNLQKKLDLLAQAESLKESTDWKKTTEICIQLQDEWKKIGPVPKEHKDEIWNKFTAACNHFFDRKREHFKKLREEEEENLRKKEEIIQKIKQINTDEAEQALKELQSLEKEWAKIGFVPLSEKERIYKEYKEAIKEKMSKLKAYKKKKPFDVKEFIEKSLNSPSPKLRLRREIEHTRNRIAKLERDVVQLENNLEFFVKTKDAEEILQNFKEKIEAKKAKLEVLNSNLKELIKAYKSLEQN